MSLHACLYTRAGCHLCEDAETELRRLITRLLGPRSQGAEIELELIDVDRGADAAELVARYGERVPVLVIGDREYAAPLPPALLERALRAALEAGGEAVATRAPSAESSG